MQLIAMAMILSNGAEKLRGDSRLVFNLVKIESPIRDNNDVRICTLRGIRLDTFFTRATDNTACAIKTYFRDDISATLFSYFENRERVCSHSTVRVTWRVATRGHASVPREVCRMSFVRNRNVVASRQNFAPCMRKNVFAIIYLTRRWENETSICTIVAGMCTHIYAYLIENYFFAFLIIVLKKIMLLHYLCMCAYGNI